VNVTEKEDGIMSIDLEKIPKPGFGLMRLPEKEYARSTFP